MQTNVLDPAAIALRVVRMSIVCSMFGARLLFGQSVRGVVLHGDSITPARGVLVELLRGVGTPAQRVASNVSGVFRFTGVVPDTFRLRVLRIGFRPVVFGPFSRSAQTDALSLVLQDVPVTLPAVAIAGKTPCQVRPDSAQLVAQVFEEARKVLLAASLTSLGDQVAHVAQYERRQDGDGVVTEQTVTQQRTRQPRAAQSISPDSLLRYGFVVTAGNEAHYFGPDPDLLLSDAFIGSHCMRLAAAPQGDSNMVVLRLEPARRRREVDIEATLILDRRTSTLTSLHFEYVGLPRSATRAGAGGSLRFARTTQGAWFIERWELRMPAVVAEADPTVPSPRGRTRLLEPSDVRIAGGHVHAIMAGSDTVFAGEWRRVMGYAAQDRGGAPTGGARVSLLGTNSTARADSTGAFLLDGLIPGRYRIAGTSPDLDSLGMPQGGRVIDILAADARDVTVTVPRVSEVIATVCARARSADGPIGMLRGTVREHGTALPIAGAEVTVAWFPPDALSSRPAHRSTLYTTDDGRFLLCGVRQGWRFVVNASADGQVSSSHEVLLRLGRSFVVADLLITPRR